MRKVILVRHGETEKNKANDERHLTLNGIKEVSRIAFEIKEFVDSTCVILTSPKIRAVETALILAEQINCEVIQEPLRITNSDSIKELIITNKLKGIRPAKTYLTIDNGKYTVESPKDLYERWSNIIGKYEENTVILVSHEGALEAYLDNARDFSTKFKTFEKYFEYGDYVILINR